jgi:methylmalonyl-CoA mutase N-terminal domain/subunit
MDETLALPTEKSVRIALRTQQVLAHETGVANTIDPLAGSYFIEAMTDELEREAEQIFAEVDQLGGVVRGIEEGYFQREIALSAQRQQERIESGEEIIVGLNSFEHGNEDTQIEILRIGEEAARGQAERLAQLRSSRDAAKVESTLAALREAAQREQNVIEPMLECVRAYCTLYEIRHALEQVYSAYKEPVFF